MPVDEVRSLSAGPFFGRLTSAHAVITPFWAGDVSADMGQRRKAEGSKWSEAIRATLLLRWLLLLIGCPRGSRPHCGM
jgi:hypothetical protein